MPEKFEGGTPPQEQKEKESILEKRLAEVAESSRAKINEIREDAEERFPEVFKKKTGWESVMPGVREAALKGETHYDFVLEHPHDYIYDNPKSLERDQLLATRDRQQRVEDWKKYIDSAVRVTDDRGNKLLLFVDAANFYKEVERLGLKISAVDLGSSDTRFGMHSSTALRVQWGEKKSE